METTFVGCTPNSVAEQREFLKGKGVGGVRVHDDGHLTIDNQTAYKDYQRAKGFINYDGGYGDMNDTHASAKEDVRTGD